jgi:hypothetical protein
LSCVLHLFDLVDSAYHVLDRLCRSGDNGVMVNCPSSLCRCMWNGFRHCAAWCLTELIVQFDACIQRCAYDERRPVKSVKQ